MLETRKSDHLTHPKYRSDIDGLRAIAILSVVGFHAFPSLITGGFVGVDIFFVISGYLISTIIFGSLQRNSFSFLDFYSRRINRIFPALLLVLAVCFAFAWFSLLADELKQLGKHIFGGAAFISNLFFWQESGYFDNAAETKPLLHLWSLGVEEQFYIVWPLIAWFAWKRRLNFLAITIALGAISFVLNIIEVHDAPVAAFYSPQTRFWELMTGTILAQLALHTHKPSTAVLHNVGAWNDTITLGRWTLAISGRLRDFQSIVGATLLVAAFLLIDREMRFPGWWALLPIVGSALLISAGPNASFNRSILSNQVLVWFGLISFPLYLWHWPLLSFAQIVQSEVPALPIRIAAISISIALAWLTYRFIERPIRFGTAGRGKTVALVILMAAAGYAGIYAYKSDGLPFRERAAFTQISGDVGHEEFHRYLFRSFPLCSPTDIRDEALLWNDIVRCFQSKDNLPIDIAIIGDSHAEHLFIGFAKEFPEKNVVYYIKNSIPTLGNPEFRKIFEQVLSTTSIKTVILDAYWIFRGEPIKDLDDTVAKLLAVGKDVWLVDDVPTFSFDPKQCKYKRRFSTKSNCVEDGKTIDKGYKDIFANLKTLIRLEPRVHLLDINGYFCTGNACSMAPEGKLLFRDNNHLNVDGSKYVGKMIARDTPQLGK
jgi:peptidoglycan/LPS O-acetylase OafA/YrhL